MKKLPAHEVSGGNVFADLGLPDADELLLKSQIVMELARLMKRKKLSQSGAAAIAGVAQPDLSNLLRGKLRGFSVERLLRMLTAFGRDVDIVVRPARRARARGRHQDHEQGGVSGELVTSACAVTVTSLFLSYGSH